MSGGGSRGHTSNPVKGLEQGAGETVPLTPKENFGDCPHQTAHTGRTIVGTAVCACPTIDPVECARIRYHSWGAGAEPCECVCHDPDPDEDLPLERGGQS